MLYMRQELEQAFNRALFFSLTRKKIFFILPILLFAGNDRRAEPYVVDWIQPMDTVEPGIHSGVYLHGAFFGRRRAADQALSRRGEAEASFR